LAEQDSNHQGAGRGTDGKATDAQAAEYRTKRNRQKQENLRRMRYGLVYPSHAEPKEQMPLAAMFFESPRLEVFSGDLFIRIRTNP